MPIYEFACAECGHGFERLQRLSDPDPEQCPACGKSAVKRQLSAPSFRLSGSGWYETDFKGDKDKRRNLTGKDDASAGSSGGDGATASSSGTADTPPATKAADKPVAATPPTSSAASA